MGWDKFPSKSGMFEGQANCLDSNKIIRLFFYQSRSKRHTREIFMLFKVMKHHVIICIYL